MAGTDAMYFLNSRDGCVTKSLGDRAGRQTLGFHFINLPVGSVALSIIIIYVRKNANIHGSTGVARIGLICFRSTP